MSEDKRIFDDFPKVNCNGCEHYYTNSCDGVPKGSERPCKSFIATRDISILEQLESLKKRMKNLEIGWIIFLALYLIRAAIELFL